MTSLRFASHVHTDHSDDSDWSLDRLVTALERFGFGGALVCDHDRTMDEKGWRSLQERCHSVADARGFTLVPGVEYQDQDHIVHLPVFGAAPFYGRSPNIDEVIRSVRGDGAAAVFAHPARRDAWRRFRTHWAPELAAIEVWNRKYDGVRPNRWALSTAEESHIPATVALDWHGPRQLFPLAVHVEGIPKGPNCDRAAFVVSALLDGQARSTAFGVDVRRFGAGALAAASGGLEATRSWVAPRIRRVERAVKDKP